MRKLRKTAIIFGLICIFTFGLCNILNASSKDAILEGQNEEYAKVHIWKAKQGQDLDHISLETGTGESYISIRPDTKSSEAKFAKLWNRSNVCVRAPVLRVASYDFDKQLEGREPDLTFIKKMDVMKIDEYWKKFLKKRSWNDSQDNLGGIQLKNAKWSMTCDPYYDKRSDDQMMEVSCTSSVLYGLGLGLDTKINKILLAPTNDKSGFLYGAYTGLYHYYFPDNPQGTVNMLQAWGMKIFTPGDIGEFLRSEIKENIMTKIKKEINQQKVVLLYPVDSEGQMFSINEPDQVINIIYSKFPSITNETIGFKECLSKFGTVAIKENMIEVLLRNEWSIGQPMSGCVVQ